MLPPQFEFRDYIIDLQATALDARYPGVDRHGLYIEALWAHFFPFHLDFWYTLCSLSISWMTT